MGWFWAETRPAVSTGAVAPAKCPVDHKALQAQKQNAQASGCPIDHSAYSKKTQATSSDTEAKCPVKHDDNLNPLNNMPVNLSSERIPGQKITLSTVRTISSIPRGESEDQGLWEYPSPQQMLNAMVRKGKAQDIPEDAVESMVDVHNFLNEGAWQQILEWEHKYTKETKIEPRLKMFTGRPDDMSPRAQMYLLLGKLFPNTFNTQPPFDRHDWTVLRSLGLNKGWKEVRYVIDYYSAPDEDDNMPAFMLDTRPALDNPTNAIDRFTHWSYPLYKKAMGEFDDL
ncbi:cytochrome c/c1 heme-lyase [Scheffersomyces xylosifermentans]|uniref:cytochrome c/c1 heme-lyase n=1 Tax=Scheffersomyces xylosifermentans TaxID=1304137 RepID=UPI00315D3E75